MTAKIIEILRDYRIWFGDSMGIHEDAFMNLTFGGMVSWGIDADNLSKCNK